MGGQAIRGALAFYRVHVGFSSRAPWASIIASSYPMPPPTTVLGALAKALRDIGVLKCLEFVEEQDLIISGAATIKNILSSWWITTAMLSPTVRTTIFIRYFSAPYRSHAERKEWATRLVVSELFAPYGLGYTVSPHGILAILVLTPNDKRDDIAKGLAFVSRLGSKESFVDPIAVYKVDLKQEERETVVTAWLTPKECVESIEGNYVEEKLPIPYDANELMCYYSASPCPGQIQRITILREAILPRYPGWVRVKTRQECRQYRITERKEEVYLHVGQEVGGDFELKVETLLQTHVVVPVRIIEALNRDHKELGGS